MRKLADVELQLLLQSCDLRSLLSFSAVNRRMRSAADSSVACKFLPPLVLDTNKLPPTPLLSCPVHRRRRIALTLSDPDGSAPLSAAEQEAFDALRHAERARGRKQRVELTLAEFQRRRTLPPLDLPSVLASLPPSITHLRDRCGKRSSGWLLQLLTHPTLASLCSLDFRSPQSWLSVTAEAMHALSALRFLHSLSMVPSALSQPHTFALMPQLPALTSLSTGLVSSTQDSDSCLLPLASCPLLAHLRLWGAAAISAAVWSQLFAADRPLPGHLRSLQLARLNATAIAAGGASLAIFDRFTALRDISLLHVQSVSLLLHNLAAAPSLRRVRIVAVVELRWHQGHEQPVAPPDPSVESLCALLSGSPRVQCALEMDWLQRQTHANSRSEADHYAESEPERQAAIEERYDVYRGSATLRAFGARMCFTVGRVLEDDCDYWSHREPAA